ncbi:MAG: hypothetical protein DI630_13270 [Gordonia sp. (in: high G+C Gram-positive bacteria)]|nr:MAG: hypothetical protein DI630_13270 [Gordonia sp. (in: high G+C Gram-positive bacteria)]
MSAAHVVAIANLKGGTGKTTTTIGLAHEAASRGARVLTIDIDGQRNASGWLTGRSRDDWYDLTIADVLDTTQPTKSRPSLADVTVPSRRDGIDVVPAASVGEMTAIGTVLDQAKGREFVMRGAIDKVVNDYDLILIDCPPDMSVVTLNAHVAATTGVLLVAAPAEGAYGGVRDVVAELDETNDEDDGLGKYLGGDIGIIGMLINDYDRRIGRQTEYLQRYERLAEALDIPILGEPIPHLAFINAAAEVGMGMDELTDARAAFVRAQYAAVIDRLDKE